MPAVELRLLGTPEVRVDGTCLPVTNRKALALLAYLAAQPGPHPREHLAALLWPDSAPEVARAALRNALVHLHRLAPLNQRLHATRTTVELHCLEDDRVDVHALTQGDPAAFRGEFLSGWTFDELEEFSAWLDEQRGAMRGAADQAFDGTTQQLLTVDPTRAAELAHRWVALDRLNEAAWRRLVRAHLGAGQRSRAREALDTCTRVLREELGVDPAPETLALQGQWVTAAVAPPAVVPSPARTFVGRERELACLMQVVMDASSSVRCAVVSGEPGIGKTALVSEVVSRAVDAGVRVLQGRASEASTNTPYASWVDVLSAGEVQEALASLDLPWRMALARLLPDLGDASAGEGSADLLPEALSRALEVLAGGNTLLVVLDDVQWADVASLDALTVMVRRLTQRGVRAKVALTVRAEALDPDGTLAGRFTRISRDVPLTRIELKPLAAMETRALVAAQAGTDDVSELGAWLHAHTQGQPLFVKEALRDLLERDLVDRSGEGWRLRSRELPGVLPSVRAVIEERLARLNPSARAIAQGVAVLGGYASFEAMRTVMDLSEKDALEGVEVLVRAGLLQEVEGGGDVLLRLSHDRVRETLTAGLSALRSRLLHRRALEALEGIAPPAVLARHAQLAGQLEAARSWLRRSAQDARRLGRGAETLRALRDALELGAQGVERVELLVLVVEAYRVHIDPAGAPQAAEDALAAARTLGEPSLLVRALLMEFVIRQGERGGSEDRVLAEEAVRLARTVGEPEWLAISLQLLATNVTKDDPLTALELHAEALELLKAVDRSSPMVGAGHHNLGLTLSILRDWEGAAEQHGLAAAAQRHAGYLHFEAVELYHQAFALLQVGQPERAAPVLEAAIAVRETHQLHDPAMRALWALTFARLGQAQRGWEVLREAFTTDEWFLLEETCYWAAWFLSEVGYAWEAAVLLSFIEARRDSGRWGWLDDLNDSPAQLRAALEGALGAALPEAMALGRAWTLPEVLRMLRDLTVRKAR